jgi:hypothetical protein
MTDYNFESQLPLQVEGASTKELEMRNTRIRNNFFTKLGIDEKTSDSRQMKCTTPSRGSLIGKVKVSQEPLKFISDDKESSKNTTIWGNLFRSHSASENSLSSSPSSSVGSGSSYSKKEPRISFNLDVVVVPNER